MKCPNCSHKIAISDSMKERAKRQGTVAFFCPKCKVELGYQTGANGEDYIFNFERV